MLEESLPAKQVHVLTLHQLMHSVSEILSTQQSKNRHRVSTSTRWHFTLHSNATRVMIANLPNTAQLQGTPTIPPSYIWVRAVVWECGEGQTDTQTTDTHPAMTNIHFTLATPHAKCNYTVSGKKKPLYFCHWLCHMLIDFQNSFTNRLSSKFLVKQ